MCSGDPWPQGARNSVTVTRPAVASLEAFTVASAPRNQRASPAPGCVAIDVTAGCTWVLICCLLLLGCGSRRRCSRSLDQMAQARASRPPRHPPGAPTSCPRARSTLALLGAVGSSSIVGRARELGVLDDWLDAVAAGKAGVALLEGEAGIGKSRLAAAACERAGRRSFVVSTASADELDRGRPFGVLSDALGSRLDLPDGSIAVPGLEFRLVDQLVEQV